MKRLGNGIADESKRIQPHIHGLWKLKFPWKLKKKRKKKSRYRTT